MRLLAMLVHDSACGAADILMGCPIGHGAGKSNNHFYPSAFRTILDCDRCSMRFGDVSGDRQTQTITFGAN